MTLDEIRNDLLRRIEVAQREADNARIILATNAAELAAHDRAVAAMQLDTPQHHMQATRAPRRDIAALVREALTVEPQTVKQVAEKTGIAPSRVEPALQKGAGSWTGQGWVKP